MPAALPVDWTAIKEAMIAGVPATDLALRFGMLKRDKDTGEPLLRDGKPIPDTTAIRGRCFRERWPVPASIRERATKELHRQRKHAQIQAQAYIQQATLPTQGTTSPQGAPSNTQTLIPPANTESQTRGDQGETVKHPPQSLEIIAERLAQHAQAHPLAMAEYVAKKRDEAFQTDKIPVPASWRELNQLDHIARRNMGIERSESTGVQVNVGVWGNGTKVQEWRGEDYDV